MRVAHVDTGPGWRGGQSQVLLLLRGLRERGHAVVLAAPDAPLSARAREAGIEWIPLRRGFLGLGAGRRLARALAPWKPDLLHAHTSHAHGAARSAGAKLETPVVVSRRVLVAVGRNPISRLKYSSGVARYLCISRAVVEAMRRAGIDDSRLSLVPSAVDVQSLGAVRERVAAGGARASLRGLLGAPSEADVVGAVGAMTREKGVDVFARALAEALAANAEARWVWIGDGPERESLESACARLGLGSRGRVLGFRSDAHELTAQLTLFLSTSRHEGLGTAVLEAQALGVPVIVTDSGGVRDTVEDDVNGRIVADPSTLGVAVRSGLGDPATRVRWRDAALASVARFTPGAMVERTLEEYARVLSETPADSAD